MRTSLLHRMLRWMSLERTLEPPSVRMPPRWDATLPAGTVVETRHQLQRDAQRRKQRRRRRH